MRGDNHFMHTEFMGGTLDPVASIVLCLVAAFALVLWLQKKV